MQVLSGIANQGELLRGWNLTTVLESLLGTLFHG